MEIRKVLRIFFASVLVLATLSGCGDSGGGGGGGEDAEKVLTSFYENDPSSFDYPCTQFATNMVLTSNCIDCLFENDRYGNLKPALAKSWNVSEDGKTYTYHIRKGVKWVQQNGEEYAEVKPTDWITGMKHAVDKKSEMIYVISNSIRGLKQYSSGENKDFGSVGVKADDKKGTLTIHLDKAEPFWNSKTVYPVLAPVNADFLKEKGKDFGSLKLDSILYCGPYIPSEFTAKSVIRLKANKHYYDKKNVHLSQVNLNYFSSATDSSGLFRAFSKGDSSVAMLNPTDASWKEVRKKYKNNILMQKIDVSTFFGTFNINRRNFKNSIPGKDKKGTHEAILNKDFRLAIAYAINKGLYQSQATGKEFGVRTVRNSLNSSIIVRSGGDTYGDILQREMNDFDPEWGRVNFKTEGNNTSYHPKIAREYMKKAKNALPDVKFPVHLDVPGDVGNILKLNRLKSLKNTLEEVLGKDNIRIDIHELTKNKFNSTIYYGLTAADKDYDFNTSNGWTPDYDDPEASLSVFNTNNGSMSIVFGVEASDNFKGKYVDGEAVKAVGLDRYNEFLDEGAKFVDLKDLDKRYQAYAKAEAQLLGSGVLIPLHMDLFPVLMKIVPFTPTFGNTGTQHFQNLRYPYRWKYVELQDNAATRKEYEAAEKKFNVKNKKAKTLNR